VQRVLDAITAAIVRPFDLDGRILHLESISMGTAFYPTDGDDAAGLVAVADGRMYAVKNRTQQD
jgi:GGDEF domain-containing protein